MELADLTGVVLDGRYRVIEPIAQGAMGIVYRAERIKLGRIVAVKVLHETLPSELSSRKRFEIEAMAMAKLEHPHCAAVVDVGLYGDRPYVVMDFVSGQNLKDLIVAEAPLPIPRAVELLRQILSGLAHAHEHGIIHRDIKPANIVLSQKAGLGDHVKILDFGLARLGHDSGLTTGIVVGTPSYMAPEQIQGGAVDGRVDVYACGVLLFELLTGRKPFVSEKDDPLEVCAMHLKQPAPRLAEKRPGVDYGELEAVIARALAKSPGKRFASVVELSAALDAAVPRRASSVPSTPLAGVPVVEPRAFEPSGPATGSTLPGATPPAGTPPVAAPAPAGAAAAGPASTAPGTGARVLAPRDVRRIALLGGGGLVLIVIVIAVVAGVGSRRGGDPAPPAPDAPAATPPPREAQERGDPADETVARATELITSGQRSAAIDLMNAARKIYPNDARLPFMLGKLYFERMYWSDGLKMFREAIRVDPSYRKDPELIRIVLRGFITTPRTDYLLAAFLREQIGSEARPFLEETAAKHPSSLIRARAAAELRSYR